MNRPACIGDIIGCGIVDEKQSVMPSVDNLS